jgi:hypothetical protein
MCKATGMRLTIAVYLGVIESVLIECQQLCRRVLRIAQQAVAQLGAAAQSFRLDWITQTLSPYRLNRDSCDMLVTR